MVTQTRGYFLSHVRTAYAHDNGSVVLDVSERKVSSVPVRVRYYKVVQPAEDKKAAKGKWRERGAWPVQVGRGGCHMRGMGGEYGCWSAAQRDGRQEGQAPYLDQVLKGRCRASSDLATGRDNTPSG